MNSKDIQSVIFSFMRQAFRPFAVLCLRFGIRHREVSEILKASFLDAARDELKANDLLVNTSKLSVMTGLQRKDILKIESSGSGERRAANLLLNVIGAWRVDRKFCEKKGCPRDLAYEGATSEFADLVTSVSKDLNPYTVLFELERVGAVTRSEGKLQLNVEAFIPKGSPEEGLAIIAHDIENLLFAGEENILRDQNPPNLHATTRYDNICIKSLPQIRLWLLKEGSAFHRKLRDYLSRFDKDLNPQLFNEEGGGIVTVGSFGRITKSTLVKNKGEYEEHDKRVESKKD